MLAALRLRHRGQTGPDSAVALWRFQKEELGASREGMSINEEKQKIFLPDT